MNGVAENAVEAIKRTLKTSLYDVETDNLDITLQRFLLDYRNVPHSATGMTVLL